MLPPHAGSSGLPEVDGAILSRLLAIGLELPEDALVEQHRFEGIDESSGAFLTMHYHDVILHSVFPLPSPLHEVVSLLFSLDPRFHSTSHFDYGLSSFPRSAEDELKTKNVWLKGHTGELHSLPHIP